MVRYERRHDDRGGARLETGRTGGERYPTRGKGVFYVHTLGCQMNVHDSERIAGVLEADGYVPATEEQYFNHDIDLIVMNTCAVRENAAERMYGTIGLWAELKGTPEPADCGRRLHGAARP